MGGSVGGIVKRGVTAGLTGGLSEFTHGTDAFGVKTATNALGITHKPASPSMAGGQENPASVLASTGGTPLLASISMGADVKGSIASYFGQSDYNSWFKGLGKDDQNLVQGVTDQLTTIQSNTNLKNQAVQSIVNDFPNIAAQAAQAHQAAGGEFDSVTKDYLDKALGANAAKYGAAGGLSSGAEVAAAGRVGADLGMQKLNYMTSAGDTAYNQGVQGWTARYNEANALRNFQNTMTQGAAGQGFSAVQASLNRNQQTNQTNAGFANQQNIQNQQNDNQLFGAIGGLTGTVVGGYAMGKGMASNSVPLAPQRQATQTGDLDNSNWG